MEWKKRRVRVKLLLPAFSWNSKRSLADKEVAPFTRRLLAQSIFRIIWLRSPVPVQCFLSAILDWYIVCSHDWCLTLSLYPILNYLFCLFLDWWIGHRKANFRRGNQRAWISLRCSKVRWHSRPGLQVDFSRWSRATILQHVQSEFGSCTGLLLLSESRPSSNQWRWDHLRWIRSRSLHRWLHILAR